MKYLPDLILVAVFGFLLGCLLFLWNKEVDKFDADRQHLIQRSTAADTDCRNQTHKGDSK